MKDKACTKILTLCEERQIRRKIQSVTGEELCREYQISKSTLRKILKHHGYEFTKKASRTKRLSKREEHQIIRDYRNNTPVLEILQKHGFSTTVLYKILRKHKVSRVRVYQVPERTMQCEGREQEVSHVVKIVRDLWNGGRSTAHISRKLKIERHRIVTLLVIEFPACEKLRNIMCKLLRTEDQIPYRSVKACIKYLKPRGLCPICGKPGAILHVDHCHVTGYVRGLLCSSCNTGLGMLKDSQQALKNAQAYLKARG